MLFGPIGADQIYTAPSTGDYYIELYGGGKVLGTVFLTVGTQIVFRVGQPGQSLGSPPYSVAALGGWPDGGNSGVGVYNRVGGGGSISAWLGGALLAIAGGSGGNSGNGGGPTGGSAGSAEGGTSYAGGNGSPMTKLPPDYIDTVYTAGGSGGKGAGGVGPDYIPTPALNAYSCGGGGGFYGGGGGRGGAGGGSGYSGVLLSPTNIFNTGPNYNLAAISYIGPNPSGTMPGIPMTIRIRATTALCYVEKDIIVRALGYCAHATFTIPALVVGTPVSYALPLVPGTGFAPIVWSSTGNIPPGLSVSSDGVLSGTPNTGGTYSWAIVTIDDSGAVATTNITSVI